MASLSSLLSQQVIEVSPTLYTTPAAVSAMTGGEVSPNDVLADWIDEASEEIDQRSGMCFRARQFVNTLDGDNSAVIFLDCFPVLEIHAVQLDDTFIRPESYTLNSKTGTIKLKGMVAPVGTGNITVRGVHGYSKVPPLVHKLATLIVAKTALSARFNPFVDNESIGDFSQTRSFKKLNDELDRAWSALGKRFRIYTL
ncbi:MAG: hypothetical protein A2218_10355 [Elusimicrobia bacterium RIFOXYA2_FULL_53_38]|nr:MAG: hypothetical protein A2218_10355 [Elusimicrobia bacterium RIFOXYA2_FULL_53_38]